MWRNKHSQIMKPPILCAESAGKVKMYAVGEGGCEDYACLRCVIEAYSKCLNVGAPFGLLPPSPIFPHFSTAEIGMSIKTRWPGSSHKEDTGMSGRRVPITVTINVTLFSEGTTRL
jgi:hypothetical protein